MTKCQECDIYEQCETITLMMSAADQIAPGNEKFTEELEELIGRYCIEE